MAAYIIPPPLPSGERNESQVTSSPELAPVKDSHDGPNVVVEYSYSDRDGPAKRSQPLILKNISNKDAAHNVRVLPVTVGELTASFLPDVVPFIEPLNQKEMKVKIDGVSPILRDSLPVLFAGGYKDKDIKFFAEHPHTLLIDYEDADNTRLFQTSANLRHRPWRNKISIGETRRRIKKLQAGAGTQAR
ncbi:MAG: hypothetical protein ABSH52_27290 [Terriglobia bacterium]